MRILLLFFVLSFNLAFGQVIKCDEILDKQPNFVKKSLKVSDPLFVQDIAILKHCGNFAAEDSILFNGPILGALMVKSLNQSETLSYGKIITLLQAIKNDGEYKSLLWADQLEKRNPNRIEQSYDFKPLISYENALSEAKKANKKLLLFFSAFGDVNSEKMKEEVFIHPEIKNELDKNFICFKTHLDDRTALPINEQYFSKALAKQVTTIGEKFIDLQLSKYKTNWLPHFIIIENNGKLIKQIIGRQEKKKFLSFLRTK